MNDLLCPLPLHAGECIQLAHGGGGRLMQQLLQQHILPLLGNAGDAAHDAATIAGVAGTLAFTSDGYVVHPLQFPGGDIGSLAVFGTVNDLVMAGARPLYLSVSLIIEEGLPIALLRQILASMRAAADRCGVRILTGDTKVVDRGKGDGLFITTSGIGQVPDGAELHPRRILPGDAILVSGDLGRHGVAILACREGLAFEPPVQSDCAPLHREMAALLEAGIDLHCARDITRGGLVSVLHELAASSNSGAELQADAIPVATDIRGACELLGLDPLYIACEGRMALYVPTEQAAAALACLRQFNPAAQQVGVVTAPATSNSIVLKNALGVRRLLDLLSGEQLPRIC